MEVIRTGRGDRPRYGGRPGRAAVVAPDLAQLHGPTSGVVELPHRIFWQPDRRINLDNAAILAWMYETVLCEAVTIDEIQEWLDGPTLIRLWPTLFVPRGIRQAWQDHHPALRIHAAAA